MRHSRFTEEQIVAILKEGDNKTKLPHLCRKYKISVGTFYRWKSCYGKLEVTELKRFRQLEICHRKLKTLYAKACQEKAILQEAIEGKL